MNRKKKAGLAFLMLFLFLMPASLWLPAEEALACSCIIPENAQTAKSKMTAVFSGTVTHVKTVRTGGNADYAAKVLVDESWKGVNSANVTLFSGFGSCAFEFETGKRYLFYAYDHEQRLNVINCGRSGEIALTNRQVADDLKDLGPGTKFAAANGATAAQKQGTPPWAWWAAAGACSVLAISIVLARKEMKRSKQGGAQ